jgi:hypothetical protein
MRRCDVAYYEARAARERALAATAPDWYAPKLLETAQRFERLAESARDPRPKASRRLLPAERRAARLVTE